MLREALFNARNAGIRQYRGREVTAGAWPAIVDRDVYEGARAILTDPARVHRPRHAYDPRFLLTGLALCGVCGKPSGPPPTTNDRSTPAATARRCRGVCRPQ